MPEIINIGLNHTTAPIQVREALALSESQKQKIMEELMGTSHCKGGVVLNTCNRCEVYLCTSKPDEDIEQLKSLLKMYSNISLALNDHFYIYQGKESIQHLFRVASGLDSMVKGEPQILGQVKEAYEFSCENDWCDTHLHEVFKRGIRAGKRARNETSLSEKAVSIGSAACELAVEKLEDLKNANVLIVGAGDMGKVVLKNLLDRGVSDLYISNRTLERCVSLAEKFEGTPIPLKELGKDLHEYDLIITSTGASEPIIDFDKYGSVLEKREEDQIFIDLAVPRDVDPELEEIENVTIYDLDDLDRIVEENMVGGENEIAAIEDIIKEEYDGLKNWLGYREAAPIIQALNKKAEDARQVELKRALNKLSSVDSEDDREEVLEDFSRSLVQKILHDPIVNLKKMDEEEERFKVISDLFDL